MFVGGFTVYPNSLNTVIDSSGHRIAKYIVKILWDWKEAQAISRPGFARVTIRFLKRQTSSQDNTVRKAGT